MSTYRVTWTIDIDAESAIDAAVEARDIQLDPQSIATQFDVREIISDEPGLVRFGVTESVDFSSEEWKDNE